MQFNRGLFRWLTSLSPPTTGAITWVHLLHDWTAVMGQFTNQLFIWTILLSKVKSVHCWNWIRFSYQLKQPSLQCSSHLCQLSLYSLFVIIRQSNRMLLYLMVQASMIYCVGPSVYGLVIQLHSWHSLWDSGEIVSLEPRSDPLLI